MSILVGSLFRIGPPAAVASGPAAGEVYRLMPLGVMRKRAGDQKKENGEMATLPYFTDVSPVFSSVFFSRAADMGLQARDEACRPPPERPV
jgi:hypothetical protein